MTFTPIALEDKPLLDSYLKPTHPHPFSDFNFSNLFIWRFAREISYCLIDEFLILKTCYPNSTPYFFYPFSLGEREREERKAVLESLLASYPNATFKSLSQSQAQELEEFFPKRFSIAPNRDRFDYVYSIPELIALSGRKYHKKKNHLNKFFQTYPNFAFESITPSNAQEVQSVYEKWYEDNPNKDEALRCEKEGIFSSLQNLNSLSLIGGLIRIDGEIVAFALGEAVDEESVVMHIEKANTSIQGIYQAINQQFLENAFGSYLWVNREEDLGIEGLRKAKLSYQPHFLLEKYEAK